VIHGPLCHFEAQRFDGAPRSLGVDDRGRDGFSFIAGEAGAYLLPPCMGSDEVLVEGARLLRGAPVGYVTSGGAAWPFVDPDPAQHEVICHNDLGPCNTVFVDGRPRPFIDVDTAGPTALGRRVRRLHLGHDRHEVTYVRRHAPAWRSRQRVPP
jgi:hypothetical protein